MLSHIVRKNKLFRALCMMMLLLIHLDAYAYEVISACQVDTQDEMGKNKVFLYRSGLAEPVDVEIGIRTEAEVQVLKGLSAGDTILTSGTLQLRTGMPVILDQIN
jgi:multidrug efflux pump subunit AcrA (membrane-fusion protein)